MLSAKIGNDACRSNAEYGKRMSVAFPSLPVAEPMVKVSVGDRFRSWFLASSVKTYRSDASWYCRPNAASILSQTERGYHISGTEESIVARIRSLETKDMVPFRVLVATMS